MDDFIKQFEQLKAKYLETLDNTEDDEWIATEFHFANVELIKFLSWLKACQDKAWQPVEWHKRQWEL